MSSSGKRCRALTLGTEMRTIVIAVMVALAGCASPRQRPEPAALEARAELPPHVVEVAQGLYSCERGYLIKQGRCIPYADIPPGPAMEISSLPSRVTVPTVGGHVRAAVAARGTRRRRPTRSSTRARATTVPAGPGSTTAGSAFRARDTSAGASWPSAAGSARSCKSEGSWRLNPWAPGADSHRLQGDASRLAGGSEAIARCGGDEGLVFRRREEFHREALGSCPSWNFLCVLRTKRALQATR
jgi:hypothetical protein